MTHAVYPGSFNPFTNTHMAVLREVLANRMFTDVTVLITGTLAPEDENRSEQVGFALSELRKEFPDAGLAGCHAGREHPVRYAARNNIPVVITHADEDRKTGIYNLNNTVCPDVKTVFIHLPGTLSIRSSDVRDLLGTRHGFLAARDMVPDSVYRSITDRMGEKYVQRTLNSLGVTDTVACKISDRYRARPYHNLRHLLYMRDWYGWRQSTVDAAIVVHDLVQPVDEDAPTAPDGGHPDELCVHHSWKMFKEMCRAAGSSIFLPKDCPQHPMVDAIEELVFATVHGAEPMESHLKEFRLADWAGFWESAATFRHNEKDLFDEAMMLPDMSITVYRRNRAAFLKSVLAQPVIEEFLSTHELYRERAVKNIQWAMHRLGSDEAMYKPEGSE